MNGNLSKYRELFGDVVSKGKRSICYNNCKGVPAELWGCCQKKRDDVLRQSISENIFEGMTKLTQQCDNCKIRKMSPVKNQFCLFLILEVDPVIHALYSRRRYAPQRWFVSGRHKTRRRISSLTVGGEAFFHLASSKT